MEDAHLLHLALKGGPHRQANLLLLSGASSRFLRDATLLTEQTVSQAWLSPPVTSVPEEGTPQETRVTQNHPWNCVSM